MMALQDISNDLDLIGAMMGTDKSSTGYNYLVHYEGLFRDLRHSVFNFIEIGVFAGASLATWRKYFDKATIIGVDINESCRQYGRDGAIVEIGSQYDGEFLTDLATRYPPRVVIDDGSHMAHHLIFSFETLFPLLEPGGIYVVEDIHLHAGEMRDYLRGTSEIDPIDYFLSLSRTTVLNQQDQNQPREFFRNIRGALDEVVWFGNAVAIRKKAPPSDADGRIKAVTAIAEQAGTAEAWDRAGRYMIGAGDRKSAIVAMQKAIGIRPSASLYRLMSMLLADTGDLEGGIRAAEVSVGLATSPPERGDCMEIWGNHLAREKKFPEAVQMFQDALELVTHPVIRTRLELKIGLYQREGKV
jgi:hypothetical protein